MIQEYIESFIREINKEINTESVLVTDGKCDTLESYKYAIGRISAFKDAIKLSEVVYKKLRNNKL